MSHTPKPGHFYATAVGMRKAYEMMSEHVDDLRAMDAIERKSAELTTYALALVLASREHRQRPEDLLAVLVSCLNDLRREDGLPEIALHEVRVPKGKPS